MMSNVFSTGFAELSAAKSARSRMDVNLSNGRIDLVEASCIVEEQLLPVSGSVLRSRIKTSGSRRIAWILSVLVAFCLVWAAPAGVLAQKAEFVGSQTVFSSQLTWVVAVDKAGNVYTVGADGSSIVKTAAGGGSPVTVASNLGGTPISLAVDGAGNLFAVIELEGLEFENSVLKIPAGGGSPVIIGAGLALPVAVAADTAGNAFIGVAGTNVVEVPANGGPQFYIPASSGLNPGGVAVDSNDDLFVTDDNTGDVFEIPPGGARVTLQTGFNIPLGIAVDNAGNVFVADEGNNDVVEILAGGGGWQWVGTSLNAPRNVAVNAQGDLFIADAGNKRVVEDQIRSVNFGYAAVCLQGQSGIGLSPCSQTLTLNLYLYPGIVGQPATFTPRVITQGAQNQDFTLSSESCGTFSRIGYYCTLTVQFAPKFPGLRQGALQVTASSGGTVLTVPLFGLGGAPQVAFTSSAQTTIPATGVGSPVAVATDGAGDVFIVDTDNNRLVEVPAAGGALITVDTELSNPLGVAVDGAGDLFIADHGNRRVVEIPSGGGAWQTVGTGLSGPAGVAVDATGDVYIADYTNNQVVEVPAGGSPQITVATAADGLSGPRGMALDSAGNLYIASSENAIVLKVSAGGAKSTVRATLSAPYGVAVDAAGDLYVADYGTNSVVEIPADGPQITLGTGLSIPTGVAVDSAGDLIVADYGNGRVLELPRSQAPALSFASTKVGVTSADSPQTVEVMNIGNQPLIFNTPATGANPSYPAGFPENTADSNLCTSGTQVGPGASCDVSLSFVPTIAGINSGSVILTDNALNATAATQPIAVSGTGVAQTISLSATSLSYPSTTVGTSSNSQSVTMTNTGGSTLSITSIAVTGTNASSFVFANSCGTSLAAGTSCTIHGHFAPTAAGALTAAVTITDNASNSPQSIALSGTGVEPPITLSATSLSYGSIVVGQSSNSQSVTMTNTGAAALSITSIAVTGTNASSFVFANTCGTSLAVGASCIIHGHFAPKAAGALKAAITITDSATGSPQSIALSGTGVVPAGPVTLSATSLSYPATTVGTSSTSQSVTMTNTGTAVLSITSIAVTGTNASSFGFANNCGTSLAVGASCIIHGHFAPTATGAAAAAVTITDSATGSPQSIALSGTGQ
jgi:sugar lactone lactonase YvrE